MNKIQYYLINQPNVIHEMIDGEVVIVNLESGSYYSLQNSGAAIWKMIHENRSYDTILEEISLMYDGTDEGNNKIIDQFLHSLIEEDLIASSDLNNSDLPSAKAIVEESDKIPFSIPRLEKFTDMKDLLLLDPIHEVDDQGWPHAAGNSAQAPD